MVVQSALADVFLKNVCGRFVASPVGFGLPGMILIRSDVTLSSEKGQCLVRHETKHQEQWRRYGYVAYPFVYLQQYRKYGYKDMPLEVEARAAE